MKICISSDPYYPYPSGVSAYTYYLAKYLRRFGHKVLILTTHYPGEAEEEDLFRIGRVLFIPVNRSFITLATGMEIPLRVKEFLKREEFDILHLNGPLPSNLSFFALHYSKTVNIAAFLSTLFRFYRIGSTVVRHFYKKYIDKIHSFIAISTSARDTIAPYIPGDYQIVPCGVDTEVFNKNAKPKEEFLIPNPKILYVGRLDQRKGLLNLLKAFVFVRKKIPTALLIVVGKGLLAKKSQELAYTLGIADSVVFKGFILPQELPRYYASSDVYCSPALGGESFGIVLLEAMAVGKPVVGSRIPGYDQVIKDGSNALFCNPRDPEDIADKLLKILRDDKLRKRLIANGLLFVQDYSWEKIARAIENIYFKTLARAR